MGEFVNSYRTLTVNGQSYSDETLKNFCNQNLEGKTDDWEKSFYQFVLEWLNSEDEVSAHTSGSTGTPKAVRLKKKHMVASAQTTLDFFDLKEGMSALLPLSCDYIAGKMMVVRALVGGLNLILVQPDGNPLLNLKQKVNFAPLVPLQVINALETLTEWPVDTVIIGGGALDESCKLQLQKIKPSFYETYGMTETVSHVAIRKVGDDCFRAVKGVMFSLDGRDCLVIDAPNVVEDKVVTNDLVELHDTGTFSFLGRYDHIINSGGLKIVPEQIEKKLTGVIEQDFIITAMPDKKLGECLVLVVETIDVRVDYLTVIKKQKLLPKYEIPKKVFYVPQFPRTDSNKIKRMEIKQMLY